MSNNVMDYEDAKIAAWLLTGLRHEAIRLGKKYEKIKFYELPVLNKK